MSYQPEKRDLERLMDTAMAWGRMQERQVPKRLSGAQKWHWYASGLLTGGGGILLFLYVTGRLAA